MTGGPSEWERRWTAVRKSWPSLRTEIERSSSPAAWTDKLAHIQRAMDFVTSEHPHDLSPTVLATLVLDLKELRRRLAAIRKARSPVQDGVILNIIVSRLMHTLGPVLIEPATAGKVHANPTGGSNSLSSIGDAYGVDAHRERRIAIILYGVCLGIAIFGTATAWLAADRTQDKASTGDIELAPILASFAVPILLAFFFVLFLRQAELHRRRSAELARLQRQYAALEPYFGSLPSLEAGLLRGLLVPQLFPRILEDDDPMRSTPWAEPEHLLKALEIRPD